MKTHCLAHLTLATGHLRMSPRSEVADATLTALAPLLAAGEGDVPGMPGMYVVLRRSHRGRGGR